MAAAFRRHGLGLILDIVPNHMGIGGDSNRYWLDVLRLGPREPLRLLVRHRLGAPTRASAARCSLPVLGESYRQGADERACSSSGSTVEGSFAVWAHDSHKLPVWPRSYGWILRAAGASIWPKRRRHGGWRVPMIRAGRRSRRGLRATAPRGGGCGALPGRRTIRVVDARPR